MSTGGAAGSNAPSDALVKGVSDLATNNAYFDGLVGWFQTQIAAAPPNTSLGQQQQHREQAQTHMCSALHNTEDKRRVWACHELV